MERAGIKRVVNGPFTFSPDGNPLVGPVQGLPGYWCACAVMAGFSQGGGVGLALSQWMVNGDPGFDVWAMDVARYGEWATRRYTNAKVRENYARRFSIRFPNEELPAARPQQTTALYDLMLDAGQQRELDQLWDDFFFMSSVAVRMHTSFLWFERSDSSFMMDPQFGFTRPEKISPGVT